MASNALSAATGPAKGLPVFTDDTRDDWRDCPIDPSWVLEGAPRARIVSLASGVDGFATTALWDCTPGTFRWQFHWDETVHLMEGVVEVTMPDGSRHRLEAGSVAFFPGGSHAVWRVVEPVRKLAVCRRTVPAPLARIMTSGDLARRALRFLKYAARVIFIGTVPEGATISGAEPALVPIPVRVTAPRRIAAVAGIAAAAAAAAATVAFDFV